MHKELKPRISRVKFALAIFIATFLIPSTVFFIMLQNPPWVHTPLLQNAQAMLSGLILSRRDVVEIEDELSPSYRIKLAPDKLTALKKGNLKIITATDIKHGRLSVLRNNKSYFVIATIDPADIEDCTLAEKRDVIEAVDALAHSGKIDAIVESSASDLARANEWGLRQTRLLRQAGVLRCVLFDGGHHIKTLPLAPDILLVPITNHKSRPFASHWFTRDSVSLLRLQRLLKREQLASSIARFPRNGVPVKNSPGMALLSAQAITKLAESTKNSKSTDPTGLTQASNNTANIANQAMAKPGANEAQQANDCAYLSITIKDQHNTEKILKAIETEIRKSAAKNLALKRVYIGVTFGSSHFPYRSEPIELTGSKIETALNVRLPQKIVVLSEPLSTWDIYCARLLGAKR